MVHFFMYRKRLSGGRVISRRVFLKGVGTAVAGSALLAIGHDMLTAGPPLVPLAAAPALGRSTFARHLGDTFHIALGVSSVLALQLFKVRDLRAASKSATAGMDGEQRFSMLFRGPVDRPLGQETYQFEHDRIGRFTLFIVPMRPEQDARYYEAIFNRLSA
jgi:hypothetical protein